jgi:hypothetical protein
MLSSWSGQTLEWGGVDTQNSTAGGEFENDCIVIQLNWYMVRLRHHKMVHVPSSTCRAGPCWSLSRNLEL